MEGPGLDTGQALPALSMLSGQRSNSFLTVAERPQALPLPAAFIPVTEHSALSKRSHAGTGAGAGGRCARRPRPRALAAAAAILDAVARPLSAGLQTVRAAALRLLPSAERIPDSPSPPDTLPGLCSLLSQRPQRPPLRSPCKTSSRHPAGKGQLPVLSYLPTW